MNQIEAENVRERNAIRSEIRECENIIDDFNERIVALNEKIAIQQEAERKYGDMCSKLEEEKEYKRKKIKQMHNYEKNIKFLSGYSARIQECIDGQKSIRSREYIEDMQIQMREEIHKNMREIEILKSQIIQYNSKIEKLEYKLRRI